ncbi:CRISPR-associated DxTHG motif protein [Cyanobacterium aponinum FACHB-4101]|nr:CRISPR-associated DxTHG motif protein [Cyanobacterium aponinum FACHB-4101]WVL02493.1 CRISPR-associated DxTHG motif protein [Cyanobacterium sp. Dongsha4]
MTHGFNSLTTLVS